MSNSGQPHDRRMRHTLRFVALVTSVGTAMSGLTWLVLYDAQWTSGMDFDEPAQASLILALIGGWLLSALVGFTLYLKGNKSRRITSAIAVVILCGLIVGLATGHILVQYALDHYYIPFCDRHPSMCPS